VHRITNRDRPTFALRTPTGRPATPATNFGGLMSDMDQAKGRVKQAVGDLTDDDDMRREGKADEAAGKAKDKLDDLKDKGEHAIDRMKDKMTD
jgi:uncharacterized protein YjbJ (UPF0337 family)